MTEQRSPDTSTVKPDLERFSLTDLLATRLSYERMSADMHQRLIDKCRQSKDPIVRAIDLSWLEQFHDALTEHTHLLTQALDVLGDNTANDRSDEEREHFLAIAKAARMQISDPHVGVLPSLQALMVVEQFNETAWGLLLALMKDVELQRFVTHFQHVCARHREHRGAVQQAYEDVALGVARRNRVTVKSKLPLRSTIVGRAGLLFGDARHG